MSGCISLRWQGSFQKDFSRPFHHCALASSAMKLTRNYWHERRGTCFQCFRSILRLDDLSSTPLQMSAMSVSVSELAGRSRKAILFLLHCLLQRGQQVWVCVPSVISYTGINSNCWKNGSTYGCVLRGRAANHQLSRWFSPNAGSVRIVQFWLELNSGGIGNKTCSSLLFLHRVKHNYNLHVETTRWAKCQQAGTCRGHSITAPPVSRMSYFMPSANCPTPLSATQFGHVSPPTLSAEGL